MQPRYQQSLMNHSNFDKEIYCEKTSNTTDLILLIQYFGRIDEGSLKVFTNLDSFSQNRDSVKKVCETRNILVFFIRFMINFEDFHYLLVPMSFLFF